MEDSLSMAPTVMSHRNSEIASGRDHRARYYLYCLLSKDDWRNPSLATVYITAGDLNVTLFSLFLNFLIFKNLICVFIS